MILRRTPNGPGHLDRAVPSCPNEPKGLQTNLRILLVSGPVEYRRSQPFIVQISGAFLVSTNDALNKVVAILSERNWITFADLEKETGFTRDELVAHKAAIEAQLRRADPDVVLTSRVDLEPEGFEVAG
jgi:hypothetical protein